MEIAIGLPNAVAGARGEHLVEFARRADQAGFSSLGTIDRVVYPNYEPLTTFAAAAAVTERIRLMTTILIAPLRPDTALLAKQAVTVDNISGGRLTLGLAPGGREDDYEVAGLDFHTRGRQFDAQLEELRTLWAGEERGAGYPVVPDPVTAGGPRLVLGGSSDPSFRRAAKYGAGWIMGGGPPDAFREALPKVESAWAEAGRDGKPVKMALGYFALGPNAKDGAERSLKHYYAWLGDYAQAIADSAATDADTVKQYASAFEDAGCDEFFFMPAISEPDQVDLLHEALG